MKQAANLSAPTSMFDWAAQFLAINKASKKGQIQMLSGESGSGKTTRALVAVAKAQREGQITFWIDCEGCLQGGYAQSLGVDLQRLLVAQPRVVEDALAMVIMMAKKGAQLVVLDGISYLPAKKGRLCLDALNQTFPAVARLIAKSDTSLIITRTTGPNEQAFDTLFRAYANRC